MAIEDAPPATAGSRDPRVVLLLAVIAAVRVLVLATAFPPFNNVDEVFHYDVVMKYARAHVPLRLTDERIEPATRDAIVLYGSGLTMPQPGFLVLHHSPEYVNKPGPGGVPPPVWTMPPGTRSAAVTFGRAQWDLVNYEAVEPPLYYALAAAWHVAGRALGLGGGHLFYWTRALNALIAAALVWITWLFAREFFRRASLVAFGAPLLVAIFPQDTMVSVTGDALAPLTFAAACYGLVRLGTSPRPSGRWSALAGVAVAAALLTKGSAVGILAVSVVAAAAYARRHRAQSIPGLAILLCAAAGPVVIWLARFYLAGVPNPFSQKAAGFGWVPKSLIEVWPHPVLTPTGAGSFLWHALAVFWRGEFFWHGSLLAPGALDAIYVISSVALFAMALGALFSHGGRPETQFAAAANVLAFVATIGWILVLSLSLRFSMQTHHPSPAWPYFPGRLLVAALVPFALLSMTGLEAFLGRGRMAHRGPHLIVAAATIITIAELSVAARVFGSAYNWFALLRGSP